MSLAGIPLGRLATFEGGGSFSDLQARAGVLRVERPAEKSGVLMLTAELHEMMPPWTRKGMDATSTSA